MVEADSLLGRLATAAGPGRPWLHITTSPRLARILIAGGAQHTLAADATHTATQPSAAPTSIRKKRRRPNNTISLPIDEEPAWAAELEILVEIAPGSSRHRAERIRHKPLKWLLASTIGLIRQLLSRIRS